MKPVKIFIIVLRLSLGLLFVYGGIQKFIPKAARAKSEIASELPDNILKIKAFIGGMKQTGYFWPMLGISEILCGMLLLSQVFALLGAVMLVPVTLNIFLFHLFLERHELGELALTGLYLIANILIIAYERKKLTPIFLNISK